MILEAPDNYDHRTVLVVEDDAPTRIVLKRLCEDAGYRVLMAQNGNEALNVVRNEQPDLVLSDILMPVMNGFELVRQLRADAATACVPIILMSGVVQGKEADELAALSGAVRSLRKPFTAAELNHAIGRALREAHELSHAPVDETIATKQSQILAENLIATATAAEQSDMALRASEQRMRAIFDHSLSAIFLADDEMRYLDANPAASDLTGYSREEILHMQVPDLVPPGNRPKQLGQWREFIGRGTQDGELIIQRKDGRTRAVESHSVAGILPGVHMLYLRDITERIMAEHALRESEHRYRKLLQTLPAAICVCDARGRVTFFNDAAAILWGREPNLGDDLWCGSWRIYDPDGSLLPRDQFPMITAIREGRAVRGTEVIIERPDGSRSYVLPHADPIRDASGDVVGAVNMLLDLTDRRRAETALQDSEKRLHVLSRRLMETQETERRALARELHDEIGQTLTALKINLETIRQKAPPPLAEALAESIDLVDPLLEQVRSMSLNLRPPLLDTLGLVAALRWHLRQQGQRANIRVGFSARPQSMEVDSRVATACFRIVQEAMTNVLRHAQATALRVDLWKVGETLQLRIRDDGKGFDIAPGHERAHAGASLGLLSMQERAALLGGRVEIISALGAGTEITVHLPNLPGRLSQ